MRWRILVLLAIFAFLPVTTASAGEPWEDEPAFKSLVKYELKTLRSLMQAALKKDYRRQAWYFADRMLQVSPTATDAISVLESWTADELQLGKPPKSGWLKQRDGKLRNLGDEYFHFGELLEGSGMDPVKYYPINVRASSYGSVAGPLVAAMKAEGFVWLGVYGPKERKEAEQLLQGSLEAFYFSQEYDDEYLKAKTVWQDARGAMWKGWRVMSDHNYKEALRLLGSLAAAEAWLVRNLGSKAKRRDKAVTNLFVFSEFQKYDQIGGEIVAKSRIKEEFEGSSGWYDARENRLMVCWRHRHNDWLGDDDLMLGHAAKVMARKHFAGGAGYPPRGRGYWLLEGLRGAFEGFRVNADGKGEIDAGAAWRLAAARALRDQDKLIPWDEFMEIDLAKARALEHPDIKVRFGGTEREAKSVDVVAAQATALVVGILKADNGKALKKFGKLLGEFYMRDSLPEIDKALGWKKGKAFAMAAVAMDAAHGKKIR